MITWYERIDNHLTSLGFCKVLTFFSKVVEMIILISYMDECTLTDVNSLNIGYKLELCQGSNEIILSQLYS